MSNEVRAETPDTSRKMIEADEFSIMTQGYVDAFPNHSDQHNCLTSRDADFQKEKRWAELLPLSHSPLPTTKNARLDRHLNERYGYHIVIPDLDARKCLPHLNRKFSVTGRRRIGVFFSPAYRVICGSLLSGIRKEGVIRRTRILSHAVVGVTLVAGSVATFTTAASAATIPVACSQNALVSAVNLANSTPASDTLVLASGCTYRMTSSHGGLTNALPVITTRIEMIGPATVTRVSLLPFRIAEISATGNLTLTTGVTFANGSAVGDGGGILNRGAVTLTGSSLRGNSATFNGGGLANVDTPSGTAPAATFTRSPVSGNTALLSGGGIYNGRRGTLTTTGVSGSPMFVTGNSATVSGGGIAALNSTATTLTQTAVTTNHSVLGAGGVTRQNGTMTTTSSPISANTLTNCVGSAPAVPNCTG